MTFYKTFKKHLFTDKIQTKSKKHLLKKKVTSKEVEAIVTSEEVIPADAAFAEVSNEFFINIVPN